MLLVYWCWCSLFFTTALRLVFIRLLTLDFIGNSLAFFSYYWYSLDGDEFFGIIWEVFLFKFLKILFILLTSSLLTSTFCLRSNSKSYTRYTIFSFVIISPSLFYSPNYWHTNAVNLDKLSSKRSFYRWASNKSGISFLIVIVWWDWCSYWRQAIQHSWFLFLTHSSSIQIALTISPLCASFLVQQNIYNKM